MSKQILFIEGGAEITTLETNSIEFGKTSHIVCIRSAMGSTVTLLGKSEEDAEKLARRIASALLDHADFSL